MPVDNARILSAIAKSSDIKWLTLCGQHNVKTGNPEVAEAANQRARDLELAAALKVVKGENTLDGRIMESLRIYRVVLKHKHGRNQAAGYTERDIRNLGPKGALIKTIMNGKKTDGLRNLQAGERLDCSYEQIAVDFSDELPPEVVAQARMTLAELV